MALTPHVFDEKTDRITAVTLDPNTITSIDPDEVHEWRIAIYDLVETNKFHPARVKSKGPYALHVSIVANYIVLDVRNPETYEPIAAHYLFGEAVTAQRWLGIGFIIVGVWLVARS